MARVKRGKENYTREEVWDILEEIRKGLKNIDNRYAQVTIEEINTYFENYEL